MDTSAIVKIYASLVRKGIKTLADVPVQVREAVEKELEQTA